MPFLTRDPFCLIPPPLPKIKIKSFKGLPLVSGAVKFYVDVL